ncbi:MAG: metal-dependent hydrolase [Candidatus Pacearchaeota archaeon]
MMYKTHIVFALFVYLLLTLFLPLNKEFYLLLLIAISTLLPDIDSGKSYINNKLKVTKVAAMTSTHRGFWHSIFGLIVIWLISIIFFLFINVSAKLSFYTAFGYLMHLLADSMTVSGIKPLWKFSELEFRWKIKTSGALEYVLFFVLLLVTVYLYSPNFVFNITGYISKIFKN